MTIINSSIKAKGAILIAQNRDLVIDDFALPKELLAGQVLVKLHRSGICGSQIGEIAGVKGEDNYLPHLLGHEGCGTILQTGPGVKHLSPEDLVVLHWRKGIGIDSETPKYKWGDQALNAGWVTTFNTHAIVSENRCTKIPNDTNYDVAALMGCAVTTGFGVVENNAKLKMGESVVVFGAGGIGLNIIQACKLVSSYPIIAVDLVDSRLNLAKSMGATHTINSKYINPFDEIESILGKNNLNVFIDNTGSTKVIEGGYGLVNSFGRVVLVGVPKKGHNISIFTLPIHFGKSIIGSYGGESNPTNDIPRYLHLEKEGLISFEKIIGKYFDLSDINIAIDLIKKGEIAGRVMIKL